MTKSFSLMLQKLLASSCQNMKKQRILFPVIFWNTYNANPANTKQDWKSIFFLNPHICCKTLSLLYIWVAWWVLQATIPWPKLYQAQFSIGQ